MRENCQSRFDEREQETGSGQTGLRRRGESRVKYPPGDYSHCACSRLYTFPLCRDAPVDVLVTLPSQCPQKQFVGTWGDNHSLQLTYCLLLPGLGWLVPPKITPGAGGDIVMESISQLCAFPS